MTPQHLSHLYASVYALSIRAKELQLPCNSYVHILLRKGERELSGMIALAHDESKIDRVHRLLEPEVQTLRLLPGESAFAEISIIPVARRVQFIEGGVIRSEGDEGE